MINRNVTIQDLLHNTSVEGRIFAAVSVEFEPRSPIGLDNKQKMARDRINARLTFIAEQARAQLEQKITEELRNLTERVD